MESYSLGEKGQIALPALLFTLMASLLFCFVCFSSKVHFLTQQKRYQILICAKAYHSHLKKFTGKISRTNKKIKGINIAIATAKMTPHLRPTLPALRASKKALQLMQTWQTTSFKKNLLQLRSKKCKLPLLSLNSIYRRDSKGLLRPLKNSWRLIFRHGRVFIKGEYQLKNAYQLARIKSTLYGEIP